MNQHEVSMEMTSDIKGKMIISEFPEASERVADFIGLKGERFHYDRENDRYFINSFYPSFPSESWNRFIVGASKMVRNEIRIPLQADIVVTGKCHCKCWHCFRIKDNREDLTFEEIENTLKELHDMGTATVGITGGEPMLRKDIKDILWLIPNDMEGQLYTTGHNIDDEFAMFLKTTNVTRVIISLDHYQEEVANKMRNYHNAFAEAKNAIKTLVSHGIYTAITVCITEELLDEEKLNEYFKNANELKPDEIRIILPIPQGNLEGNNVTRLYSDAIRFIKNIKEKNKKNPELPGIVNFCEFESAGYMGCGAGANYISINNDGLVTPCVAVPLSFGNIREKSLKEIFESMAAYFPKSSRICYGKLSGKVMARLNTDTSITPLNPEMSKIVACNCTKSKHRATIFDCFVS